MLKLAWRNLWRNWGRTLIMLTVVSFSFGLLLINMGIADYVHAQMEKAAIDSAGGSVLVEGEGYWASQSGDLVVREPEHVHAAAAAVAGVELVVPRVHIMGLLTSPRGSAGVRLSGIDPEAEAHLQDYRRFVVEGVFVGPGQKLPLVLGRGVVEDLKIELGDKVVLTATGPDGEVVRALFYLSGVLETGIQMVDDGIAFTSLPVAQDAVGLGSSVTQLGIVLARDADRFAVRDAIEAGLGERAAGLEVLTWDQAIPEMVGFIEIDDAFFYVYAIIVFIVVAFGIANTFLMSVMERIRELGLLSAIGLTPRRIVALVFAETTLMAIIAVALGLGLGLLGHTWLSESGLDLRDIYDADMEISGVSLVDTIIRSELRPVKWLLGGVFVFAIMMLSALYPAWRASRLDPAQAMRTYE